MPKYYYRVIYDDGSNSTIQTESVDNVGNLLAIDGCRKKMGYTLDEIDKNGVFIQRIKSIDKDGQIIPTENGNCCLGEAKATEVSEP